MRGSAFADPLIDYESLGPYWFYSVTLTNHPSVTSHCAMPLASILIFAKAPLSVSGSLPETLYPFCFSTTVTGTD